MNKITRFHRLVVNPKLYWYIKKSYPVGLCLHKTVDTQFEGVENSTL